MKFKKDGKVFEDIHTAHDDYCQTGDYEDCEICPLFSRNNGTDTLCYDFCTNYPQKAAKLMGFEVIEDKAKPRICEVRGVEVGEEFTVEYPNREYERLCVHENGTVWEHCTNRKHHKLSSVPLCWIINHPKAIKHLPRLTDKELEICRAVGAKWVALNDNGLKVSLWNEKPNLEEYFLEKHKAYTGDGYEPIAYFIRDMFPSIKEGDCICVEDL